MMIDVVKEVDIMMDILEKVNDLISVPTDEKELKNNLGLLFSFYSKLSDESIKRIFERKVYSLYGSILDDELLSISGENEIESLLNELDLPSFHEYFDEYMNNSDGVKR